MAKLITEFVGYHDLQIITEETEKGKKFKIKGPFLVAEEKNRNGRVYRKAIIEREVNKFQEKIKRKNALGELDHPTTPTVNVKNAAIAIDELKMDGNVAVGIATALPTTNGKIVESILGAGYSLGVSSRGVGTINADRTVNEDYNFITEDVVADPSATKCYVEGILENKEYIIDGDSIVEVAVQNLQKQVDKNFESKAVLGYLMQFINEIRKK